MSTQPAPVAPDGAEGADRRASLFTPGPRLGWEFRDRRQLAAPFPQPRPDLEAMRAAAAQQAESAEKAYRKIRKFLGIPSTLLFVVLLLANGCAANVSGSGPAGGQRPDRPGHLRSRHDAHLSAVAEGPAGRRGDGEPGR